MNCYLDEAETDKSKQYKWHKRAKEGAEPEPFQAVS